jgi:hypothetical protein
MKVIVQQMERRLFLRNEEQWTPLRSEAMEFATALEAIVFCIQTHRRAVRLLGSGGSGKDVYLYPFGGDPGRKLEMKKLRRSVTDSQRLKRERRILKSRIDMLVAGQKEEKKQFPFKRGSVGQQEQPRIDTNRREPPLARSQPATPLASRK